MSVLRMLLAIFMIIPSLVCAMDDDLKNEKERHKAMVIKWDKDIVQCKKRLQSPIGISQKEKYVEELFEAYMQKAARHYHLGEKNQQIDCYKDILEITGLSKVNVARTHVNIAVVNLHKGNILAAVGQLDKAQLISSIEEIEKIVGGETFKVFAEIYGRASLIFYRTHSKEALKYQLKAMKIPNQEEHWYALGHFILAVCYDRLMNPKDSLNHALKALTFKSLTLEERDRALGYAAMGSWDTDKPEDCIRYFEQIKNLKSLFNAENFLVLTSVRNSYFELNKWKEGLLFGEQALEALDSCSPQDYEASFPKGFPLYAKYNLATAYGESGNTEREMELYNDVLESIRKNTFEPSEQEYLLSVQRLIEMSYFTRVMKELESKPQEIIQEAQQKKKLNSKETKKKLQEKSRKQFVEEIKKVQKEAVEREQRLDMRRKQKLEEEKKPVEERKKTEGSSQEESFEFPSTDQPVRNVPEKKTPKVKTHKPSGKIEASESKSEIILEESVKPTLPPLGKRAKAVFDQIESEDWSFTREDYSQYLEDFQCVRRESGGSHRIFQLPKTTLITLEKDGQEISEQIFLADEEVKLGSVTLPVWKEKTIPFYLRKQLRTLHEKIIKIYTKVTKVKTS